eukprot:1159461-Pelagomonas_calceolata.AAC.2
MDMSSTDRLASQNLQIPEHATNRHLPKHTFPRRFPDKLRLTSWATGSTQRQPKALHLLPRPVTLSLALALKATRLALKLHAHPVQLINLLAPDALLRAFLSTLIFEIRQAEIHGVSALGILCSLSDVGSVFTACLFFFSSLALKSHRPVSNAHRSATKALRSSIKAHRPASKAHKSVLKALEPALKAHGSALIAHRPHTSGAPEAAAPSFTNALQVRLAQEADATTTPMPSPGVGKRTRMEQQQQSQGARSTPQGNGAAAAEPKGPEKSSSGKKRRAAAAAGGPATSARKAVRINLRNNLYFEHGGPIPDPMIRTPPTARSKNYPQVCSSNIADTIAKEMESIGGLAGSGWGRASGGGGRPLSPHLCFHSRSTSRKLLCTFPYI